ncbi:WD repeat-containing protein 25 [Leuresthes tenuis]|uniref:WD repeat-containing protein 25 n=1 Tax=Leuresthes tenuis TaxID=355514 RepID=UPI003B513269
MSSLVAYGDSESEEDCLDQEEEEALASVQSVPSAQTQEAVGCVNCEVMPFPASLASGRAVLGNHLGYSERSSPSLHLLSQTRANWERESCSGSEDKNVRDPATQGGIESLRAPSCFAKSSSDGLNPAKRQVTVRPGVRPYISKRQRLAASVETVNPKYPSEPISGSQSKESQILTDVSARVKPYLSEKSRAAGIPTRLLMSLGGHQGPVNKAQWCPVPHLSHLLLSASMDKTFKVWDGTESGRCLRVYTCHLGAVRDACWTPCGRQLLTGSFDNTAVITDVETGQQAVKLDNQFKVMSVVLHPSSPEVFLCGGYSSVVKAWDSRSCKVVKVYKAGIQQTLDILFLRGGQEFITSSDCVSRDSADRTLIAWDYQTTAKVSNQIYQERYTCPSLALHPQEESFVAQTNGNYMAMFSSQKPYRMNKRRRFEGHKVEGYAVQCDFSLDGTILASGSSTGSAHFYDYHNARMLHTFQAHSQPCLCVSQHPVLPTTVATCDWAGEIKIWD